MVCEEADVGVEIPKPVDVQPPVEMRRRVWPQHTAALLATLLAMSGGIVMGWSTPAVPYLQEPMPLNDGTNGTTVPITDEEGSWLGSLSAIGALVGAAPAGFLSDLVGRKRMLLLYSVPLIASWIMIILVERNLPLLYLARILGGSGFGASYALIPIYNEEISEVSSRGTIVLYCEIMNCIGIVLSFAAGSYLQYMYFNIFSLVPPLMFLLSFAWMPESPMWLLKKDLHGEAEKSLRWLRGAAPGEDDGISLELEAMREFLNTEEEDPSPESTKLVVLADQGASWFTPAVKVIMMMLWLMVFQQMSGINAVMFNAVSVYQDASSSLDANVASIVTGLLEVLGALSSWFVVERFGRRPLLVVSMVVCSSMLALMALYFNFKDQLRAVGWVPTVLLSTYIFGFEIGLGPLPWLMMAELSPGHAKKTISAIASGISWFLAFAVTKTYTNMIGSIGLVWSYAIYSISAVAGIIFVCLVVPETKHKTREQIQRELRFGGKRVAKWRWRAEKAKFRLI